MIDITNPNNCCGCTACQSICGHNAIQFVPDALGFLYPKVDLAKCVNCGLCEKVCAFNDHYDKTLNLEEPLVYGVRHKDLEEVMKSRSGASFIAISDYVLNKNGVVYGVGLKDDFTISHDRATNKIERDGFRGSKYVQSDLTGIFRQIKQDLSTGKIVLFVGTACQTSGLNSYIGKRLRQNLILVDIICHGTPSNKLWLDYIRYLEKKHNTKITAVNFRDKMMFGWESHNESYKFDHSDTFTPVDTSFYKKIFLRKSCNSCPFCNTQRPSDITLGDFWGWEKAGISINRDNKGLNLILINTQKGKDVFDAVEDMLFVYPIKDDCYKQPNLCAPTPMHPYRDVMESDYSKKGFEYVFFHDYYKPTIIDRIRRQILLRKKNK